MTKAKKTKDAAKRTAAGAAASGGASQSSKAKTRVIDTANPQVRITGLTVDDFQLLKVLGKGSFGKVMLVRKKDEGPKGDVYAMKTLRKKELVKRRQLEHTQTERSILQHIKHPFLVALKFAFQTDDKLYMVLEYMAGGELFHWLKIKKRFPEAQVRLYAAEISLALGCLHSYNIVYRDLKPENILLDADGHLRLADFGLAKENVTGSGAEGGTSTFCGTPEYLAPEILANKGHGKAVDWWSMGTLLYELLCGLPPHYDPNTQKMYQRIQTGPLKFPASMSPNSRDMLAGLLTRDVAKRLGSTNDVEDIKASSFFTGMDWDRVYNKGYTPELKPDTSGVAENFDEEFTREAAIDSVVVGALSDAQREKVQFQGFTFQENAIPE